MHRFFVRANFADNMTITGQDAHHIANVLRMKNGEEIQIVSLDQVSALMTITEVQPEAVKLVVKELLPGANEPVVKIHLVQGLPKSDKLELIIQKAVELGVVEVIPTAMHNSVVKLRGEKAAKKVERWQKIAEAAAKQSKREIIPGIAPCQDFSAMLTATDDIPLKILAYEVEDRQSLKEVLQANKDKKEIALLIGPEGGIDKEEVALALAHGWQAVSLGKRILRTETAGLAAMAAILYEAGDFGDNNA